MLKKDFLWHMGEVVNLTIEENFKEKYSFVIFFFDFNFTS